jgi:hypothetical protein
MPALACRRLRPPRVGLMAPRATPLTAASTSPRSAVPDRLLLAIGPKGKSAQTSRWFPLRAKREVVDDLLGPGHGVARCGALATVGTRSCPRSRRSALHRSALRLDNQHERSPRCRPTLKAATSSARSGCLVLVHSGHVVADLPPRLRL